MVHRENKFVRTDRTLQVVFCPHCVYLQSMETLVDLATNGTLEAYVIFQGLRVLVHTATFVALIRLLFLASMLGPVFFQLSQEVEYQFANRTDKHSMMIAFQAAFQYADRALIVLFIVILAQQALVAGLALVLMFGQVSK